MLISVKTPIPYIALRLFDIHDQPIRRYAWFNTETMFASIVIDEMEQRAKISRFAFHVRDELGYKELCEQLPEDLHDKIVLCP